MSGTTLPLRAVPTDRYGGTIWAIFSITLSGNSSGWTFTTSEGKIGATADKKMSKTAGTTTWTISINNGNATIQSTTTSYGSIQFNASSPRFLNYSSSQTAIQIYKVTESGGGITPTTFTVTVANDIANGSVSASPNTASADTEITLTAIPATGYEFGSWNVTNESTNAAITVTDNKFIMPAADVNVSATFMKYDGTITKMSAEDNADIKFVTGSSSATYAFWANSTPLTANNLTLSGSNGSSSNYSYYDGSVVRFYQNNSFTITPSNGAKIEKVEIVRQNDAGNNTGTIRCSGLTLSSDNKTTNTNVFTGSTTSAVTFTNTAQCRFTEIRVYTKGGKTLNSISASGTPAEFWKGDAFNHDGITVTALWDDESETDVTSECSFTGYNMSNSGQQTVTVTFKGETCQYGIEVKTIANTQETAYTVAEAKALIDAGKDLATQVYVKGTVSEIVTAWSDQYNNITYAISDDGQTTGTQFQLFRCVTNGAEVGDNVIAYGTLKKYSSTYEFDTGNTIVDIQKPAQKTITALAISGAPTKTTYNVGDAFETAGLAVTATYSDETTAIITTGFDWEIDYGTSNEALVAGATSVDVMVYTDEVMSDVYTVNGLTVTVPVTLTSIAVSGTPTKTEYYAGDAFETAGLVVTGTYSDSHQETITEGIEWTVDPETLTLGTTSVDVIAGVGSVVSEIYTVNGLTVTKAPYEAVTYEFSEFASEQTVELTDLDGFVITLQKGESSSSNPAWNSDQAKLYAGGSLTVKANNAIIKSIEYVYAVNAGGKDKDVVPTIEYVEGTTYPGTWDVENKTWTGADEEVTFSTLGSAGNIGFTKLIIKYVEATKIETSLVWSANEANVVIGADDNVFPTLTTTPVDLAGVTYESSNTTVATIAEDGTITLVKAGETNITAKYAGDAEHAAATPVSYTLTVNKAPFVPTLAAKGYETVDFATLYSSVTNSATVEDYEGTSFAMAFAKPQSSSTPTKYYDNGKAVRAYEGNTITITGAESITDVDIAWAVGYVDDAVSITGLGTTTAVVTFSKTCRFTEITVYYKEQTISISEVGYTTYFNSHLTYTMPAGCEGYVAYYKDGKFNFDKKYDQNSTVPAGVALVIKGNGNYTLSASHKTWKTPENNDLRGTDEETLLDEDNNCYFYALSLGKAGTDNAGKVGFYWMNSTGAAFTNSAHKAYLKLPKSSNVKGFAFKDLTDAIQKVETEKNNGIIYNVAGQRVGKAQKGLYIKDGRKFIVK